MSRKHHLLQRGSRWYYNRAYPSGLTDEAGRRAFRVSLHTTSLDEAIRARPEAERLYFAAVDKARALGAGAGRTAPSDAEAASLAVEWFRQGVAEDAPAIEWTAQPDRADEALASLPDELADLRRELVQEGGGAVAVKAATEAAARAGFTIPGPSLGPLIQRARIARAELFAARLVGDYGKRPSDPLFASALEGGPVAAQSAAAPVPKRTVADLIDAFKADRWEDIKPSSRGPYEATFRAVREIMGEGSDVALLTRENGRAFFDVIRAMPVGYGKGKRWKGVDMRGALAAAQREGLELLSPATINRVYMGLASTLFGWAVREGWMPLNPVKGLRVRDPVAARDKRSPFTSEQLQALFSSPPWSPPDLAPRGRPIRYWLPLIALYQGMRLGEIAQLRPQDFHTSEGVELFEVQGDLKTDNARRTLPVHPELARLGLLDFVNSRKGAERLFDGEEAAANGKWGDATGDWFGRHIRKLGLEGTRLGVHSFRHNFQDALRRAGLHGTALGAALAGRAGGDKVADAYGSGFAPKDLAEAIAKVSYPGLKIGSNLAT